MHPACLAIDELSKRCTIRRQRRSGPGGQHRNKVETGIFVRHLPSQLEAEATECRSQARNLALAMQRLRVRLAIELRHPITVEMQIPSELWLSRLRGRRVSIRGDHADFAAMLAECMDILWHCDIDFAAAADMLHCSRTQLVRLLSIEHSALAKVNSWRAAKGEPPLIAR